MAKSSSKMKTFFNNITDFDKFSLDVHVYFQKLSNNLKNLTSK